MSEVEYFYAVGNEQRGPVGAGQLIAMNLAPSTLVWREGLANWQSLDSLPEFAQPRVAPMPPPQSFAPPYPQMQTPPYPQMQPPPYGPPVGYSTLPARDPSKRIAAGIFGILMGALGIHKFILGYTGAGLTMLLVSLFTCGYAAPIFWIIGLIEGIIYLSTNEEDFYQRYMVGKRPWF